jgi:hypothetical protein
MQLKCEYGCDPIIIEGVIALGLRKLPENEFLFNFSLMVEWIQMIFGIQMYHEDRDAGQVRIWIMLEYYCRSSCHWT